MKTEHRTPNQRHPVDAGVTHQCQSRRHQSGASDAELWMNKHTRKPIMEGEEETCELQKHVLFVVADVGLCHLAD